MEDDFSKRSEFSIKRKDALLLDNIPKNWKKTLVRLPDASTDIVDSVVCLCSHSYTASVFHLMRVAEHGLRALAHERRVTLKKNRPLRWADWQELLQALDKKLAALNDLPRGAARGKAINFYSGVLSEFGAFKDAYRKDVMHARARYDEHQARSVMQHVCEFMERLTEKVSAKTTKQITWSAKS